MEPIRNEVEIVKEPEASLKPGSFWTSKDQLIGASSHEEAMAWAATLSQTPEQMAALGQANAHLLHAVAGLAAMNMKLQDQVDQLEWTVRTETVQTQNADVVEKLIEGNNSARHVKVKTSFHNADKSKNHLESGQHQTLATARQDEFGLQTALTSVFGALSGLPLGFTYSRTLEEAIQKASLLLTEGERHTEQNIVQEIEIDGLNPDVSYEALVAEVSDLEEEKSTLKTSLLRWRLVSIASWLGMVWILFGDALMSLPVF